MNAQLSALPTRICGLAVLALLAGACGGEPVELKPVATVGGVPIPAGVLTDRVAALSEERPEASREHLMHEELSRLVTEQVILNRAAEIGVEVRDSDVDARLRRLHGEDFEPADDDYREEVRRQMTIDRTALLDLADQIRVPETALMLYFDEHRAEYAVPERVEIRHIVVRERELAEQLRRKLLHGADFAELATAHSAAPEADAGGLLPPFAKGELPEAFDVAFTLKSGKISKVIESPYGFHLFKLERRLPGHEAEFEEVRDKIALELERQRMDELRRDWLRGLQRSAEIRVDERLLETL